MEMQTRRSMLKGAALAAGAATLTATDAVAQKTGTPEKKNYGYGANRKPGEPAPLFNADLLRQSALSGRGWLSQTGHDPRSDQKCAGRDRTELEGGRLLHG